MNKELVKERLRKWGIWLRTARSPSQGFTMSKLDSPLSKKRIIKAIYRDEQAENLEAIMAFHMSKESIMVLELHYAKQVSNPAGAAAMGCCIRTYTSKRREAESILQGILTVIENQKLAKTG